MSVTEAEDEIDLSRRRNVVAQTGKPQVIAAISSDDGVDERPAHWNQGVTYLIKQTAPREGGGPGGRSRELPIAQHQYSRTEAAERLDWM